VKCAFDQGLYQSEMRLAYHQSRRNANVAGEIRDQVPWHSCLVRDSNALPSGEEFARRIVRRETMNCFQYSCFATLVEPDKRKNASTRGAIKCNCCVFYAFEVFDFE
jgi:hypothetical protein